MLLLHVLDWLLLAAEICIAFPVAYLCLLSCSALISVRKRATEATCSADKQEPAQASFALLVPAHNEEMILGTLLESLSHLDYPQELYTVYVIADNCTDTTALLADQFYGVQVY